MEKNTWQQLIKQRYTEIKQDDVSLILYPVGFNGIKHLKSSYQERLQYLQENFMAPTANTRYEDLQNLWEKYRINYEHYFQFIQDIQPRLQSTQDTLPITTHLSPATDFSMSVTSVSFSLSTNKFQEITQSSKDKATANAEKIKSLLDRANSCYDNNQLKEAQDWCSQVLEIDPHHSECKYLLGLIYTKLAFLQKDFVLKQKLFQNAASYLENEVIKNPGQKIIESYRNLGFIYYKLSQWEKAVDSYQESFKREAAERIDDWEEHLEAFVTSLNLISNRSEPSNVAIQFCQRLANLLAYGKKAYPYYFMAVLQQIRGDLNAAWNSIETAMNIYNRSSSMEVKYESVQKARQKYQEIKQLKYRGYY